MYFGSRDETTNFKTGLLLMNMRLEYWHKYKAKTINNDNFGFIVFQQNKLNYSLRFFHLPRFFQRQIIQKVNYLQRYAIVVIALEGSIEVFPVRIIGNITAGDSGIFPNQI